MASQWTSDAPSCCSSGLQIDNDSRVLCELVGGKVCIAATLQYCRPRAVAPGGSVPWARHKTPHIPPAVSMLPTHSVQALRASPLCRHK